MIPARPHARGAGRSTAQPLADAPAERRTDDRTPVEALPGAGFPPSCPGFDWPRLIALGLGRLRLDPTAFWSLSPRELTAALGADAPAARPLTRAALDRLAARFPDAPPPHDRPTPPTPPTRA